MKKKSIIKFGTSLALVAAIGVGATFAYLQSGVQDLSNTFTIGNGYDDTDPTKPALVLDELYNGTDNVPEPSPVNTKRTMDGNTYTVDPGTTVTKDPQVSLKKGSPDSYIFVAIDGLDSLKVGDKKLSTIINEKWNKISSGDGYNGIYVYTSDGSTPKVVTALNTSDYTTIAEKVFEKITIPNMNTDEAKSMKDLMSRNNIEIYAVAVQHVVEDGNDNYTTAASEATALLNQKMSE